MCSILLNAQHEIRTARCDTSGQLLLIAGSSRKTGQFGLCARHSRAACRGQTDLWDCNQSNICPPRACWPRSISYRTAGAPVAQPRTLCAEPSRRERALLQIPLLRAQHVLRASGSWESASSHYCSQKAITPCPLVIAWFHFSETDALLAVCGLRCIVGGGSMLRPPQPLSSHATCWPAAALWRAHLHASPSSCGMAGSAAHRTCERLAIDHLTLLHRATHTLVAQTFFHT